MLRKARADLLEDRRVAEEHKTATFGEPELTIEESWPLECALRIENHMWSKLASGKLYSDKSRSLLFNLQDKKNPNARIALLD